MVASAATTAMLTDRCWVLSGCGIGLSNVNSSHTPWVIRMVVNQKPSRIFQKTSRFMPTASTLLQAVADTADGFDFQLTAAGGGKVAAQIGNMNVDAAVIDFAHPTQHGAGEIVLGGDAVAALQQRVEHVEFGGGEFKRNAGPACLAPRLAEGQFGAVRFLVFVGSVLGLAAQHGA